MLPEETLSLADYQRAFWARVTLPGGAGDFTAASSSRPVAPAVSLAQGNECVTADERLAVYAFMYQSRLAEALAATFPRLAAHLGHARFCALSAAYAAERPSRNPSLRHFGAGFSAWLRVRAPEDRAACALAELEWARADIFDAPDETPLDLAEAQALMARRGASAPLGLIRAHRLLSLPVAVATLWDAPEGGSALPALLPEHLVVWRQEMSVYHRVVGAGELRALHAAARISSLGALCEGEALREDDLWLADGLLASGDTERQD